MEYLFKGKTVGNINTKDGLWVFGLPFYKEEKIGGIESKDGKLYTVIPETIGQFTGLTDKNGKKIFEGDIVQGTIVSAWNKALICCEVVYNKGGFISVERTRNQDWVHKVKFAKDIEVIGNIHDNPELLGE